MARALLRSAGVVLTILVAGCGSADDASRTSSPQEAQALNDAAAMLDDNGQDAIVETNADAGAGNVE